MTMKPIPTRDLLARLIDPDMFFVEGFEEALIGAVEQYGRPCIALYDKEKVLQILQREGMSKEEAKAYFDEHVVGAWVGDYTPAFAIIVNPDEVGESE